MAGDELAPVDEAEDSGDFTPLKDRVAAIEESISEIHSVVTTRMYIGPLPSPDSMVEYDRIVPGSAKKIFDEWERESHRRHELNSRGMWITAAVALGGMAVGGGVAVLGAQWAGSVIAACSLGGIPAVKALEMYLNSRSED